MIWIAFGSRLLREMTAQAAPGFGTFHLMRIMFDDYFLYLVELLHIDERAGELMRNIQIDIPPEYPDTDYEGNHQPFVVETVVMSMRPSAKISPMSHMLLNIAPTQFLPFRHHLRLLGVFKIKVGTLASRLVQPKLHSASTFHFQVQGNLLDPAAVSFVFLIQ